jgi:large subunit ribosomal protein L21
MYAVIRAGGKQYRVTPGDVIKLESFAPSTNGKVEFAQSDILAVSPEAGKITTGGGNASVTGQVVDEGRAKKILVFHYKRKKQYKKLQGHRQGFTAVRITEIALDGQKSTAPELPARKAKAKAEAAPKAEGKAGAKSAAKKSAAPKKAAAKKSAAKKSSKK